MNGYYFLHNLRVLDRAGYNEKSGRPELTYDEERLHLPPGIQSTSLTKRIQATIIHMPDNVSLFEREYPFLFQLSDVMVETPQSKKIKAIFIWAGVKNIEGENCTKLIKLFERPDIIPQNLNGHQGFTLTERMAQANQLRWSRIKTKCVAEDFFKALAMCKTSDANRLYGVYYVVSAIPLGLKNYLQFKNFLPGVNKTTFLTYLIFRNVYHFQGYLFLKQCGNTIGLLQEKYRKQIIEIFVFSDELQKLTSIQDPELQPKTFLELVTPAHRVDYERRTVGIVETIPGICIDSECFISTHSFAPTLSGVLYRSYFGKLTSKTLENPLFNADENWWKAIPTLKEKLQERVNATSCFFNDFNYPLMKKAMERNCLVSKEDHLPGKLAYSQGSQLLIYFLSFLKPEHENLNMCFEFDEKEMEKVLRDKETYFKISDFESKCVLLGLWIKHILKSPFKIDPSKLERILASGSLLLSLQKTGEKDRLLPTNSIKEGVEYRLMNPLSDTDVKEVNDRMADFLLRTLFDEYTALQPK